MGIIVLTKYESHHIAILIHDGEGVQFIVPDDIYIESKNRQDVIDVVVKWLKEEIDE